MIFNRTRQSNVQNFSKMAILKAVNKQVLCMKNNEKEELSITGIVRDRKVACSSPGRSGGGIFFSSVDFLC